MQQKILVIFYTVFCSFQINAQIRPDSINLLQPDQTEIVKPDTALRIINLNPFFSLHVDSSLNYYLQINKDQKHYYWFLKNAPAGLRIDKDNGGLSFKSNKSLFLSGKLKYDVDYPVKIGVQNLSNPQDRVDTSFIITFYNTDVILPHIKSTVVSPVTVTEGDKLSFNIMCENGNFPIDKILMSSSATISNFKLPKSCDDSFEWMPPYDFVNEKDSGKVKLLVLFFVGTTKFNYSDTAKVKVIVKDGLDFDIANKEYQEVTNNLNNWILKLKFTFLQLDKKVRKNKNYRSAFDITSASTTVSGTVVAASNNSNTIGKVLPSVGVVLLPVKEAAVPNKNVEQNQATLVRSTIKRLEYVMFDNRILGEKDPLILTKTDNLKKELRQSQIQLVEVPTEVSDNMTEKQLNNYFNNPRVQKKYRLK
jgi:hypothetical protein